MRWFSTWRLLLSIAVLAVAACDALPPALLDSTQIQTEVLHGVLITAAEAPQSEPPAVVTSGDRLLTFWIGSDERGVHHDARIIRGDSADAVVTLPLPPVFPFAQTAVASSNGGALLLWLDRGAEGETALFAALINPDLQVERGPVEVSDEPVYHYAAVPDGMGGVWVTWSGGSAAEPAIYARRIDNEGRPLSTTTLRSNGSFPAMTYDSEGRIWALWLANGQLWRGQFSEGQIVGEVDPLTSAIQLNTGDRLMGLDAGSDGIYGYVFWNVIRSDGSSETWMLVGSFNDPFWAQPRRFTTPGGSAIEFAAPLDQPSSPLPIAIIDARGVGLLYAENGRVFAEFPLVTPAEALRPPVLTAYADGKLLIGWSEPDGAFADLRLLTDISDGSRSDNAAATPAIP